MNKTMFYRRHLLVILGLSCIAVFYGGYAMSMFIEAPAMLLAGGLIISTLAGIAGAILLLGYVLQLGARIVTGAVTAAKKPAPAA